MRFDRTAPYGQVIGLDGVAYEQNGRYYNPGGKEVTITGDLVAVTADEAPVARSDSAAEKRAMKTIYGDDA